MRERPILFSAPMVRAILDGSKTQTRLIVKPQPEGVYMPEEGFVNCEPDGTVWGRQRYRVGMYDYDVEHEVFPVKCPYGAIGDRLWIKTGYRTRFGEQSNSTFWSISDGFVVTHGKAMSKSGKQKRDGNHPGIAMPFWLSQEMALPLLEITGVRVERLQDISEADAMAEGCQRIELGPHEIGGTPVHPMTSSYVEAFRQLWQSINGPESWSANPWVWVIQFRRLE